MRKPKNLPRHELIGLRVLVSGSENSSEEGTSGKVVDETKNTLTIDTENGEKRIKKTGRTFDFDLPSGKTVRVKGEVIEGRPEERIKAKLKKW